MATLVKIACRLPHGILLDDPQNPGVPNKRVLIKGLKHNPSRIALPDHITEKFGLFELEKAVVTEVDAAFWEQWKMVHAKTFDPYLHGAFWEVKSEAEAIKTAEQLDPSGLEPIDPKKEFVIEGEVVKSDVVGAH